LKDSTAAAAGNSSRRVSSARGRGSTLSEISVMTPKMPSEPHSSRETSKPATFFITCPPKRSSSPSPVRSLVPNTKSRAAPAYTRPVPTGRRDHAADAGVTATRRLEGEKLPVCGERRLDLGQGRAAASRDDQLRGL